MPILYVIDIDGTVANIGHRAHFVEGLPPEKQDWTSFLSDEQVSRDEPYPEAVAAIQRMLKAGVLPVFLTGRSDRLFRTTKDWLLRHIPELRAAWADRSLLVMRRPWQEGHNASHFKRGAFNELKSQHRLGADHPDLVVIDNDPYIWPVVAELDGFALRAPDCWPHVMPVNEALPVEIAWRT